MGMQSFRWNLGKNLKLKTERGVGFEMVVEAITRGAFKIAKVKSKSHPGQKCFLVRIQKRTWVVPFREGKTSMFLHTIFELE
jgi:hypothetical protein